MIRNIARWLGIAAAASATLAAAQSTVTVVEYYNAALDHYFMSPLEADISALDSGRFTGWARTGQTFQAYANAATAPSTANAVCRYYIPPQHGDSHFFSASPTECLAVQQRIGTDPNYSGYILESPNVFYIQLPNTGTGACPAGTVPVYRLWNQSPDSNHRYVTDPVLKATMLARGYVAEGYGTDGVNMCAPTAATFSVVRLTSASPFAPGCDGAPVTGALYAGAEVEPIIAVNPRNPNHLLGTWQQDRWSNGGSQGLLNSVSIDGGQTWSSHSAPFSRCTGGSAANGGDYARASDPWVSFAPDGTAYAISLSINGGTLLPGSSSAVLVSRSGDGGFTWGNPTTLIRDGAQFFNDKEAITADPTDAHYVYAVWDRLIGTGGGPSYFSRTVDFGASWEPPKPIYDPGSTGQTLGNQIVVLPNGTLVNFFTRLDMPARGPVSASLAIVRSIDKGLTWSTPITIAQLLSIGVHDPENGTAVRDAGDLGSIAVGPHGELAVVWQDARFSSGARDAIAYSRSTDGGLNWSAPVSINAVASTQAFIPTVRFTDSGLVGVTYYDFRNNTVDASTLPTDLWLARSVDGQTWSEARVAGPFDLAVAPRVPELFLGDYQGLANIGETFVPLFAQTNSGGDANNRTDVLAARLGSATPAALAKAAGRETQALAAPALIATPEFAQRVQDKVLRSVQQRMMGHDD